MTVLASDVLRQGGDTLERIAAGQRRELRKWEHEPRAIRALQVGLERALGRAITPGRAPDGLYGNDTFAAVAQFQAAPGVEAGPDPRGLAGRGTLLALDGRLLNVRVSGGEPSVFAVRPELAALVSEVLRSPPGLFHASPGLHVVTLADAVQMRIVDVEHHPPLPATHPRFPLIATNRTWRLTDQLRQQPGYSSAIFVCGSFGARVVPPAPGVSRVALPLPVLGRWVSNGYVFIDGASRYESQPNRLAATLSYSIHGGYRFAMGDTFPAGTWQAMSGLIPMIIEGQVFRAGGRGGASGTAISGNSIYAGLQESSGRCFVGHCPARRQLVLMAQEWVGSRAKYDLDSIRDFAGAIGCTSLVGLDGGDSAFMIHRGRPIFEPGFLKNLHNRNAVGFFP
jgi:hypothetical protein